MADKPFHLSQKEDHVNRSPAELLEVNEKLDDELRVLRVSKLADECTVDETNVEALKASILELSEELVDESVNVSWRNRLLKRAELGKFSDSILEDADNLENEPLVSASSKQIELASETKRLQEEISGLEEAHKKEKCLSHELRITNQALVEMLRNHQSNLNSVSDEVKKHPNYKKLKAELDVRTMSVDINKNLLTQIIIGAGMDWMSDPYLQNIMLNQDKL